MLGWGAGLRRVAVASALGLVGGAIVLTSGTAARAATVDLNVDYRCTGGVAKTGSPPVFLRTTVTIPTTLNVGDPLNISWRLAYKNQSRFGSPARFAEGARISIIGNMKMTGDWVGILQPKGYLDQTTPLVKGTPLVLPEGISDFAHLDVPGTVKITPDVLHVDFTPPVRDLVINDDDPDVKYNPVGLWADVEGEPNDGDIYKDYHQSNTVGDTATLTFTGTGIEYIGQLDREAGPVAIELNGKAGTPPEVDPSLDDNGMPHNFTRKGGQTLWRFTDLPYKEHTIQIKNVTGKRTTLDAFKVITQQLSGPPPQYRATCKIISNPVSVDITIGGGSVPTGTPTGTPTTTPTDGNTPTPDPTDTTPGPTGSNSGSPSPSNTNTGGTGNNNSNNGTGTTVLTTATATATASARPTTTVTATHTAQVRVTPIGAAQTGELPERNPSGLTLLLAGCVMLGGGIMSGVAMRRRRAAHAGRDGAS